MFSSCLVASANRRRGRLAFGLRKRKRDETGRNRRTDYWTLSTTPSRRFRDWTAREIINKSRFKAENKTRPNLKQRESCSEQNWLCKLISGEKAARASERAIRPLSISPRQTDIYLKRTKNASTWTTCENYNHLVISTSRINRTVSRPLHRSLANYFRLVAPHYITQIKQTIT